jgi:hypothetical protein
MDSFENKVVVCSGSDPAMVFNRAIDKGARDPIIFFVPEREMTHIY